MLLLCHWFFCGINSKTGSVLFTTLTLAQLNKSHFGDREILAANSPSTDSNKTCMESHLHIWPVEIINCLIFHTYIYIVSKLLLIRLNKLNSQRVNSNNFCSWKMIDFADLGAKDFCLWESWWYTDIEGNIILVNKSTGFSSHLTHHPWA